MARQIPFVDYLVLGEDPHLSAHACTACGARFFDRRNACAACGGTAFERVALERTGVLRTFTVVAAGPPGVAAPFVTGIVDCGGTSVRANVINLAPDPERVQIGMKLALTTYVAAVDDEGTEAVAFAFEPLEEDLDG